MDKQESSGNSLEKLYSRLKKKIFNRNVMVFSFFLVLSFIFWFVNSLNEDIEGDIRYQVRYVDFPDNLALVNELPPMITLDVRGQGYSMLAKKIRRNRTPLVIDVNSGLLQNSSESELEYYMLTLNLINEFNRQLKNEFSINAIDPDTLYFIFDKVVSKKVIVQPDIDIKPQRQFMISGSIKTDPDSVIITGPGTVIDTINFVLTRYQEFNQVNDSIKRFLEIESIQKVGISHKEALLSVPVEQFTEEVINLDIQIQNKPDTANVRLFPEKVDLHFNIPLSDYNRIQDMPVEAIVDMNDLDVLKDERLNVEIRNLPDFIKNVRYNPDRVEYIIEKK